MESKPLPISEAPATTAAANTQDELLRRPLYLFDLPQEVLDTLTLYKPGVPPQEEEPRETGQVTREGQRSPHQLASQSCSLCSMPFADYHEQRRHLKSDLHYYNVKQRQRNLKTVTEDEFEKLIGDLDESLSGSDTTEYDESDGDGSKETTALTTLLRKQATLAGAHKDKVDGNPGEEVPGRGNGPLVWFGSRLLPPNHYFGIYRNTLSRDEWQDEEKLPQAIKKRQLGPIPMPKPGKDGSLQMGAAHLPRWFLCLMGGGHFAAMVVALAPQTSKHGPLPMNKQAIVLAHKTFHRYTTRRKQGGGQSAHDKQKGTAKSVGSAIRRQMEVALTLEVRALLCEWKGLIEGAEHWFIRASGSTNRDTLYSAVDNGQTKDWHLDPRDERNRSFPFNTRRATQQELMRCFIELTRLKVREFPPEEAQAAKRPPTPTKPTHPTPKSEPTKLSEKDETALLHTTQLQALLRRSKLPALLSYLATNELPADFRFFPPNHHAPTALHLAASLNAAPLVTGLLERGGADPTLCNGEGQTAFALAGDRATRDAFRGARGVLGEPAWDWDAAGVPPGLSRAEVEGRAERERKEEEARRRAEEERVRKESAASEAKTPAGARGRGLADLVQQKMSAQDVREQQTRGLTEEQKRRLERERRARAAEARLRGL